MKAECALVSVGVPTYNRPDELRRCLDALLLQTHSNLQIIVSDNGSPDNDVKAVAEEFEFRDSRVKYVRQETNLGAVQNFQYVLKKADGEYFMWAADDDYRDPAFVEVLVSLLVQRTDCTIGFCDFYEIDPDGIKATGYPHHYPLLRGFTTRFSLLRCCLFYLQLESKGKANLIYGLFRRSTLLEFDWPKFVDTHGEYGSDMLFVFTLLRKGPLALSEKCLYQCTVGNDKFYSQLAKTSYFKKFASLFNGLSDQIKYAFEYIYLTRGPTRALIIVCFPLKVVDIFVRLFLVPNLTIFGFKSSIFLRRCFAKKT